MEERQAGRQGAVPKSKERPRAMGCAGECYVWVDG